MQCNCSHLPWDLRNTFCILRPNSCKRPSVDLSRRRTALLIKQTQETLSSPRQLEGVGLSGYFSQKNRTGRNVCLTELCSVPRSHHMF